MSSSINTFFRSNIGHKIIMSLTGVFLILFIVIHLLGNLGVYAGRDTTNDYSVLLHHYPKLLWTARIGLILAFVLHIRSAVTLAQRNMSARGDRYAQKRNRASTLASRTMLLSGLVVISFLAYHLAHFTWGLTNPDDFALIDPQGRHDVYGMVVLGFQNTYVSFFYIVAQVLLAMHLSHGFSSVGQTLGLTNRPLTLWLRRGGIAFSILVFALFTSIPVSVWLGLVTF